MTVDVAEAQIRVGLSDEGAIAGLRRVEAAYDRTMENIRHQRAVAQVDADLKPFQRKLDVAKAEVRKLSGQRAAVLISANVEPLERKLREARARVKSLAAEKATILAEMPTAHLERDVADAKAAVDRIRALRARVILDAGIRPLEEKVAEAKSLVKGFEDAKKLIATFDGNIEPFERKLAEARARVKEFEGRIASGEVVVEYDEDGYSEAMAELAALRAAVKVADGERATVELAVRGNTSDLDRKLDQARNDFHKAQVDLNDAEIRISGDITPLDNDLAEAEAHVKKTAAILSTTKVAIEANTADLDEALVHAKAEVAEAEAEWADVSVDIRAKTAELDEALAKAQAEVALLDGQVAEVEVRVKGERAALDELAAVRRQRDEAAAAAERLSAAADKAILTDANARRRLSLEHGAALRMDMKRQQLLDSEPLKVAKAQAQVTKLYNEYTKATKAVERLARTRVPLGREGRAEHVAAVAGARAKLLLLKAQLQALGAHPPVEIKVDTDVDRGRIKRRFFLAKESFKNILDKVGSLGDLTARIGPFTASLKQIGLALAVLGPTLTDLVGGAGALVGVLGTGIAGAAAVGSAALLGFGQAGIGVSAALKPVIDDYKSLNTLTKALSTATLKYGAGSKQAGHAQGQLNRALAQVDPVTRQAFRGIARLRTEWHKATDQQARKSFGHIVAEGVKTASALLPQFADQTNKTLGELDKGTSKWLGGLRSLEGRSVLNNTFSNANKALGPLMSGLGSLATAFGRIASSASNFLPGLTQGFANWAKGLADGVSNASRVDAAIQRLVHHMQDLGHFTASLGRLLTTVFSGGADAGDEMVQHMTTTFDRWNADLKADGGKGLRDFFSRAVKGTEALAAALGPVIRAFIGLSTNLSPFVTGIFQGIAAVGKLANAVLDVTALKGPVQALGFTLAAAFSISRIGKFIDLVQRAGQLVRAQGLAKGLSMIATGKGGIFGGPAAGLSGTAAAVEISTAMEGAGASVAAMIRAAMIQGGMAAAGEESAALMGAGAMSGVSKGGVALPKGVKSVAPAVGGIAAAEAATAGLTTAGVGAAAAATAVSLGITAVGAAALYGAYKLATMKGPSDKLKESLKKLDGTTESITASTEEYTNQAVQIPKAHRDYKKSVDAVVGSKKRLEALDRAGKRNTQEYRDELSKLNFKLQDRQQAEGQVRQLTTAKLNAGLRLVEQEKKQAAATKLVTEARRQLNEATSERASDIESLMNQGMTRAQAAEQAGTEGITKAQNVLNEARARARNINAAVRASENSINATYANSKRVMAGMIALTGKQEQQLGRLAGLAPKTAANVALKFPDPIDAGNVAASAAKSLASKKVSVTTVNKIVADSSSADQAIARLKAARITTKWRVAESGGKEAVALLRRISNHKLSKKEVRIAERGGPAALRQLANINNRKLGRKNLEINYASAIAAKSALDAVASAINNIPGFKDIYIRAHTSAAGKAPHARGGGPGIGGRTSARDYVTDRAAAQADRKPVGRVATAGRVSSPTYLVGEEGQSEFIISSNPTYRRRNRTILAEAARTIGWGASAPAPMVAAKRGTVTAHPGLPASIQSLPVPNPYSVAAVDESAAESAVTAWRNERARRKDALAKLRKDKAAEKKAWDKKDSKQKSKAAKQAHSKRMADYAAKHKDLVQGMSPDDTSDPIKTVAYSKVTAAVTSGGRDLKRLKHANANIAHDNANIAIDRTRIDRMASIYANPKTTPDQRKKAKQEYDRVKANRLASIKHLVKLLARAKSAASALAQMAPWSDQMRATLDSITGQNEDALTEMDNSTNEPDATQSEPDTADTFIERMGFTQTLKDDLLALAKSTTTATTTDDDAAKKALFDFYGQQVIPAALTDPAAKENTDLLTELYNAQGSYAPGADSTAGLSADAQAQLEQTNQREHFSAVSGLIDKTFGYVTATMPSLSSGFAGGRVASAAMGGSPVSRPTSPPSSLRDAADRGAPASRAAEAASGGNVTVNFNALTADPKQARQAADVIVGGIGYQGGRQASSTKMGA